jgi:predicted peptidase
MKNLLIVFLLLISGFVKSQNLELYEKHLYLKGPDTLPYRLLLPENYDPSKKYPLVVFLHGAGERGRDNQKQLVHGGKLFLRDSIRKNFPAIILFPQCPPESYWSNVNITSENGKRTFNFREDGEPTKAMAMAQELVRNIIKEYPVQKKQVYVGGLSMGGMGTFEIVRRNKKLFAAAFPICGGAHPSTAKKMKKTSFWVFHGGKDDVVIPAHSEKMVDALNKGGADVKFTLYPNANHNSWDPAFAEPGLMNWLFSKKK